jgi:V8-like Glu-specific endopeptidase
VGDDDHALPAVTVAVGAARFIQGAGSSDPFPVLVIGYGRPNVYVANRTSCRIVNVDGQGAFLLDCLLTPGTSGGPVLRATEAGYEIVGVVSGTSDTGSLGYRFAGEDDVTGCAPYFGSD